MHLKVPVVWRGSGLVKTSSVGMFDASVRPSASVSKPPSQRVPCTKPTSSSVPGPRSSSRVRPSFVNRAERRLSVRTCLIQPLVPFPSSSSSRQKRTRSRARRRFAFSGSSSG